MATKAKKGPVYHLQTPARVDTSDVLGEHFEASFAAGDHAPKNEREEIALELLWICQMATKDGRAFHPSAESRGSPAVTEEAEA